MNKTATITRKKVSPKGLPVKKLSDVIKELKADGYKIINKID